MAALKEITVEPQEIEKLVKLCSEQSTIADYYIAKDIAKAVAHSKEGKGGEWIYACTISDIFRIGFILGQRSERSRRKQVTI